MWPCLTHALRPTRSLRSRSGKVVFGESCFCFSIFGDIKPNFGPFLEHLRNGLENKTCFIPLGIRLYFCQELTQNGLEIIVFEKFLAHFWTIFWNFLLIFAHFLTNYWYISAHFQDLFLIFRNYLGITTSFRPILAHFWNILLHFKK